MRDSGNKRASMAAALAITHLAAMDLARTPMPQPQRGISWDDDGPKLEPRQKMDPALRREIDEWNAAVEARKQAKALARQRRNARVI